MWVWVYVVGAPQIHMEAEMKKTGYTLERRMGQVTLWRQEREDEVHAAKEAIQQREAACADKERGLQFLEVQLEETAAELNRRESALGLNESEAADR